jgi:5,10-methylenetetrahydromethanopterin reductase
MRMGIFNGGETTLDEMVADAKAAADAGFASFWTSQIFGFDALTLLAVIGREVPDIELGTAVVPTYPRHPAMLAAQALTTNVAAGGRLALGIGLSHKLVIEDMFGMSFEKPARHMREYLSILMPLIRGEEAGFDGETMSAHLSLAVPGAQPMPVLIAALGPAMLKLAGSVADGTVTWMTGPQTLAEHTVPTITAAATEAGNGEPRIASSLPVCVTDDVEGTRARAAKVFAVYGVLPSYRAMLDREGAEGPADVALIGDEATVRAGVKRCEDAGVTDFVAAPFASKGSPDRERTWDLLQSLA